MNMTQAIKLTEALTVAMETISAEREGAELEKMRTRFNECLTGLKTEQQVSMSAAITITEILVTGGYTAEYLEDTTAKKVIMEGLNVLRKIAEVQS